MNARPKATIDSFSCLYLLNTGRDHQDHWDAADITTTGSSLPGLIVYSVTMESTEEDKKPAAALAEEEGDSDEELEGMDVADVDEEKEDDAVAAEADDDDAAADAADDPEETTALAKDDEEEMEEARKERLELMAAESRMAVPPQSKAANVGEQLNYLLAQSEVFAHFLAGT